MTYQLVKRDILILLHKKLYPLGDNEQLPAALRVEIYDILKKDWSILSDEQKDFILSHISESPENDLEVIKKKCLNDGFKIVTIYDDNYPELAIKNPPPVLFVRGELPSSESYPYIAFVGARKATIYGKESVDRIVSDLIKYRPTIVSGLAYGIDAASHRAALKYELPTVAVLGSGIDSIYPASHRHLYEEVSNHGAVISEFPLGTPPLRHNFPIRNRLISGLSRGVVVIEAQERSGSLITASWAADQGKEVLALPGNIDRAMSKGTNLLLRDGANPLLSYEDIVNVLKLKKIPPKCLQKKNPGQNDFENAIKRDVFLLMKKFGSNIELIASKTGLETSKLLEIITEIELDN